MALKKRIKRVALFCIVTMLALAFLSYYYNVEITNTAGNVIKDIVNENPLNIPHISSLPLKPKNQEILNEGLNEGLETRPVVLFCPRDSCSKNIVFLLNNSNKIHCAFFELSLKEIIDILKEKNASVVIDSQNYDAKLQSLNIRKDKGSAYMHNKFCVLDDKIVITGSMNPTVNDDSRNNNNIIIFFSKNLAKNYEDEFNELWSGQFGRGNIIENPIINIGNITIKNYFCPEDWCANKIMDEISNANKSIYFMVFSFTHDKIGDLLVKKHEEGILIKGIFEKSQNSTYSEFQKLKDRGIDVRFDKNNNIMHHKVFIIDNETVITGSFNPSLNADTRNDENIVIIKDTEIAKKYIEEFSYLFG
ncbi:MAG: phospholipase D-like domain-containing protein [Candidatus Woesearchaeota archaeon]|nr:phospholipase D-like domain-containing protein [Candidatus Woesearchaeota archaeon]